MRPPIAAMILSLALGSGALAEHARISLEVAGPDGQETAHVDQTPPDSGKNPRPVLRVKAGDPIKVRYLLTNLYPHKTIEGVVVHFFIAREDEVGQTELPVVGDDVVLETAFDLDFRPGTNTGGRATVRIDEPGAYLVRVETLKTQSDHEHFAAIDLVVERP